VLAYNIPGVTRLVLTREQIVGIYNGSIDNWADPTFAEHNGGVDLPNATIVPVARYESSGSTEIFTRSLSSFSDHSSRPTRRNSRQFCLVGVGRRRQLWTVLLSCMTRRRS